MATILAVDDDAQIRTLLEVVLTRRGHRVLVASTGAAALELFQREHPRITILDLQMPEMNGLTVLQQIRDWDPAVCVIILTGADTTQLECDARHLGATKVLQKGPSLHRIGDIVGGLLAPDAIGSPTAPRDPSKDTAPHVERRRHPRVAVQLSAKLTRYGIDMGKADIVNLSVEGCAIKTGFTIQPWDYFAIDLTLLDHETSIPLKVNFAAVRWVHPPKCGLEFIFLAQEDADRLRRYVHGLQGQGSSTPPAS